MGLNLRAPCPRTEGDDPHPFEPCCGRVLTDAEALRMLVIHLGVTMDMGAIGETPTRIGPAQLADALVAAVAAEVEESDDAS